MLNKKIGFVLNEKGAELTGEAVGTQVELNNTYMGPGCNSNISRTGYTGTRQCFKLLKGDLTVDGYDLNIKNYVFLTLEHLDWVRAKDHRRPAKFEDVAIMFALEAGWTFKYSNQTFTGIYLCEPQQQPHKHHLRSFRNGEEVMGNFQELFVNVLDRCKNIREVYIAAENTDAGFPTFSNIERLILGYVSIGFGFSSDCSNFRNEETPFPEVNKETNNEK